MSLFVRLGCLLCLTVVGCEKKSETPAEAPAKAFDLTRPTVDIRIGAILMQQDQFFRANEAGMKAAAKEFGATMTAQNATGALDKEISLVESLINQQVRAIVISPLSEKASVNALKKAHDAGIKIVTYNNSIDADFPACTVASDQSEIGASTGRAVVEYVRKHRKGKANIAIIGFASQLPEQGNARLEGFKREIANLPGIKIVAEQDAWIASKAAEVVSELLVKKPDIIWGANEGATVGAVTAVRNAGKAGKIVVFGTDVSKQIIEFLMADDKILRAVTAQRPRDMGYLAMEAAIRASKGKSMDSKKVVPVELFQRGDDARLKAYLRSLDQ
ncbi:MAG: substrate-binding domain-containing protein [Phycisphaerae bacterium]|nr:substrate-binding domain-containing protein [Phycisphaerae bacterium]